MKTTTEMQLVPITKLVPYVNNARTHSPEQINKLRSSLREFGFINPVIIDRDYGVIAGHSSMANSVVLDPFGGSGSTLIACEQTDRICYTIELDEKFCDVIVRRYIEQVGTDEKVSVLRDGKEYKFSEVAPHDE